MWEGEIVYLYDACSIQLVDLIFWTDVLNWVFKASNGPILDGIVA